MATAATPATAKKTKSTAKTTASKKAPDAIKLLKTDHDEVEAMFEQFEKSKSDTKKKTLADKICLSLRVHTQIEEEIFYPACEGVVDADLIDEADVEHAGAKNLIAEIETMEPGQDLYDAKVKVLSEYIKHHVKEEEEPGKGMFAQARKGDLDMDALGARMAARKAELMAEMKLAYKH